jgi:hypothetical protein
MYPVNLFKLLNSFTQILELQMRLDEKGSFLIRDGLKKVTDIQNRLTRFIEI